MNLYINQLFDLINKHIVITGAGGHLCGAMAAGTALGARGSIINVSSIAGKRGTANNSAYVATKFGYYHNNGH